MAKSISIHLTTCKPTKTVDHCKIWAIAFTKTDKQVRFFFALTVFIIIMVFLINVFHLLSDLTMFYRIFTEFRSYRVLQTNWWRGTINASLAVSVKLSCIYLFAPTVIFSTLNKLKNRSNRHRNMNLMWINLAIVIEENVWNTSLWALKVNVEQIWNYHCDLKSNMWN